MAFCAEDLGDAMRYSALDASPTHHESFKFDRTFLILDISLAWPHLASFSVGLPVVVWLCWARTRLCPRPQLTPRTDRHVRRGSERARRNREEEHIPVLNLLCGFHVGFFVQ